MQLISEMGYDPTFAKQAAQAGYIFRDGLYYTSEQLQAYENIPYRQRTETIHGGLSQGQLSKQLQQTRMQQTPDQQQQYAINRQNSLADAINRQNSLADSLGQQQLQSMTQRNAATDTALANAQAAPGPGRSFYDQRLQQMMLGSFDSSDPSYQWRMEQALTNAGRAGAARGMLGSGNMAAELLTLSSNLASQEYGAQFNRLLQASANATQHYTAAYGVLDRMLSQQQSQQNLGLQQEQLQQNLGLQQEQLAQEWARVGQGWNNQNLGMFANDASRWDVGNRAAADAGRLSLERDKFEASEKRLDNWNAGQGAALNNNTGLFQQSYNRAVQQGSESFDPSRLTPTEVARMNAMESYYRDWKARGSPNEYAGTSSSSSGPVLNNVASQLPSGTGYISNSSGKTTTFGNRSPSYQPWGNDYGYEAVYGD